MILVYLSQRQWMLATSMSKGLVKGWRSDWKLIHLRRKYAPKQLHFNFASKWPPDIEIVPPVTRFSCILSAGFELFATIFQETYSRRSDSNTYCGILVNDQVYRSVSLKYRIAQGSVRRLVVYKFQDESRLALFRLHSVATCCVQTRRLTFSQLNTWLANLFLRRPTRPSYLHPRTVSTVQLEYTAIPQSINYHCSDKVTELKRLSLAVSIKHK